MINHLRDWIFKNVHSSNLVYNICWEDPRCDRQVLNLGEESKIVMITSAGCNALDYLLDNPAQIHCIDLNSRQNALLELKKALFKHSDYKTLYNYFGEGSYADGEKYYKKELRKFLPAYVQDFWDRKIEYFSGKGAKKSFYFRGSSGTLAWLFVKYMRSRKKLYSKVRSLLESKTLEEQKYWYNQVESKLFNKTVRRILSNHYALAMAGVPRAQRRLISEEYPGGVGEFIVNSVRRVFTEIDIRENYFWRVYIDGHYTKDCCPSYLVEDNFDTLRDRIDHIKTHTTSISQFLIDNPGEYSNYILLDHQDWLAAHNVPALEEEWQLILKNSKPGTRILMRSAAMHIDFFPDFVKDSVEWIPQQDLEELHNQDRVGTYGCVYVGIVK
jgi:S-adenosylmethionine-diacylglycerol 3-amino-3-carboxypropyl transferase